jgi:hypothetical protein
MAESQERRFGEAMHEIYRIVRGCGRKYRPTEFHEMLETRGCLETAHRLLRPEANFFACAFEKLLSPGKPKLTMDPMIPDRSYADELFSEAELRTAFPILRKTPRHHTRRICGRRNGIFPRTGNNEESAS